MPRTWRGTMHMHRRTLHIGRTIVVTRTNRIIVRRTRIVSGANSGHRSIGSIRTVAHALVVVAVVPGAVAHALVMVAIVAGTVAHTLVVVQPFPSDLNSGQGVSARQCVFLPASKSA